MMNLTAYNKDVQKFVTYGTPEKRDSLIQYIEGAVQSAGRSFSKLFPYKSKRKDVMNAVLLLLSGNGICKISRTKLAVNAGCSVRTVSDAVNALKETGEILVAGLADGKNKYIFVLKSHPNFHQYMKEVFYIDDFEANGEGLTPENVEATPAPSETSTKTVTKPFAHHVAQQTAHHVAQQENAEPVGAVRLKLSKWGSKSFKSFKSFSSKQEINNYIASAVEADLLSIQNDEAKEAEQVATYYSNEFQHLLYKTFRNDYLLSPEIRDSIAVLGLRLGSNCTNVQYLKAYQTIIKIDGFIKQGGKVREGIPALFTSIYKHGLKMADYARAYQQKNAMKPVPECRQVKPMPLYNWLEIRD